MSRMNRECEYEQRDPDWKRVVETCGEEGGADAPSQARSSSGAFELSAKSEATIPGDRHIETGRHAERWLLHLDFIRVGRIAMPKLKQITKRAQGFRGLLERELRLAPKSVAPENYRLRVHFDRLPNDSRLSCAAQADRPAGNVWFRRHKITRVDDRELWRGGFSRSGCGR